MAGEGSAMVLAVDVGNSNTTVGLFDGAGTLRFRSTLETFRGKTRDQCAIDLLGVLNLYGADVRAVGGAILSSVVPPLTAVYTDAMGRLIGAPPLVVGPGIKTGLNIRAEIHNQLGSDIVASAVAAIAKYPSPIVMVDMGTATSISLIVGSVYEGCSIMPGLALALDALSERAAALPPISLESAAPVPLLGRTTEEAMRSGVLYGHASMVDGTWQHKIPEYKLELAIIVGRLSRSMVFCSANVSSKSCARSCASSTPCNKSMPSACGNCTAPTMAR